MKKLIPALILLLVSAMVLSTSSYAWFSMNRTVSATGMSLTSTAPANLLITNGAETPTWGATVISDEVYTGKIFPASTIDGLKFFALADGQKIGDGDIGGVVEGTGLPVSGVGTTVFYKGSHEYASSDPNAPVNVLVENDDTKTGYWAEYTLKLKTTGSSGVLVYLSSIEIADTYTAVLLEAGVDFEANQIYYVRTGANTIASPYVYTKQVTGTSSATTYYTKNSSYTISDCVRVAIFNVTATAGVPSAGNLVGIYDVGASENDEVFPITEVIYDDNDTALDLTDDFFTSYTASAADSTSLIARDGTDATKFANTATFTVAGNQAETTLLVRVWIEGQNTKCINSIAGQNFNIGLTFNIKANAS